MYDTLRELHCKFWKELPKPEIERQYDEAFRELMRRLEKLERKLVLRLLDTRACWQRTLRSTALRAASGLRWN